MRGKNSLASLPGWETQEGGEICAFKYYAPVFAKTSDQIGPVHQRSAFWHCTRSTQHFHYLPEQNMIPPHRSKIETRSFNIPRCQACGVRLAFQAEPRHDGVVCVFLRGDDCDAVDAKAGEAADGVRRTTGGSPSCVCLAALHRL